MKTFAKRLKAARVRAGYKSAQTFAFAAGLEPHAYRKYERGEAEPHFDTLVRMCELLRITADELLPVNVEASSKPEPGAFAA